MHWQHKHFVKRCEDVEYPLTYLGLGHRIVPNMQQSNRFFFSYYFYGLQYRLPLVALKK